MQQYRKRASIVDAFQMTRDLARSRFRWPQWLRDAADHGKVRDGDSGALLVLSRADGEMQVHARDWIVRPPGGQLFAVKPDVFTATYDTVQPEPISDPDESPAFL